MELSGQDEETLKLLEEGLWREETRFDRGWMEEVLAPDFFEFGRSGRVYTRQNTIDIEPQPIDARLPLSYFRARLLDSGVAQVTYVSAVSYDGVLELANRSSIWSRTENGWKLRFHQGTAIPDLSWPPSYGDSR